jgi:hypothetical protein
MGAYFDERRHTVWDGVVPPAQRRPVIVMPFWLGDANGSERTTRGGLDVKYVAGNGVTTLLTLQPDFENIAADVARVDFSYTEKVLAETRPFFQEGKSFLPPSSRVLLAARAGAERGAEIVRHAGQLVLWHLGR